ncbi:hypothetical protein SAMN05660443_1010 [Marinospirillum celere]|uniref:DUF2232 domain-containing protein n=1 Tax=Marinospirillum celere TaxID=1122252 RepID=A0A1I1FNN0_9GAMM|nr:hypothetical protein [Marinospirillum celere]SFB98703.1 hypothetical protein SAMN05660443_1010 [Marinospirillum celere]
MRFFAEFVMKSRSRAAGAAVLTAFLPVLSLISGAILALVWLRMGRHEGLYLLFWVSLPGVYYLFAQNNPDLLLLLLGTALLAEILRQTQNWPQVLLAGMGLGSLVALGYQWLPDDIQEHFIQVLVNQGGLVQFDELSASDQQQVMGLMSLLLNGVITAVQILLIFISLFLARWWQALLYNPGGFQEEFHQLRMPSWFPIAFGVVILAVALGIQLLLPLVPLLFVPLLIAGLALIHWVVAIKQYNTFWLGMLYVLLLFALPYLSVLLVLIAMADSLMNFRQRLAPPPPPADKGDDGDA